MLKWKHISEFTPENNRTFVKLEAPSWKGQNPSLSFLKVVEWVGYRDFLKESDLTINYWWCYPEDLSFPEMDPILKE